MQYPSLLWENTLSVAAQKQEPTDKGTGEPETEQRAVVPENSLADLVLPLDFSMATRALLRRLCSAEEIRFRGELIWAIADTEALDAALDTLYRETEAFERLLRRYDRANPEAAVLLFPAVAAAYLQLLELWQSVPDSGRMGVVRAHMEKLRTDSTIARLREDGMRYRAIRRAHLTVQSEMYRQTAFSCGDDTAEARFTALFAAMGVPDALPQLRMPKEADDETIHAYAVVYPHVRELAQTMRNGYAEALFGEAFSIRTIVAYAGEIAFLREMARHTNRMRAAGYDMCLPEVSALREIRITGMRDMALVKRDMRGEKVVPNDVEMTAAESFFLLGGANGGGKTTYLRALGLSVLFALTGCPIAARNAHIYPFRRFFTHFPANETFSDTGRFLEEEKRVRVIREAADADTVALFNETFSGTYEKKAEEYSRALALEMAQRGVFGVYVTHIHALTGQSIPSLAAAIDPDDENRRTYRIRRVDRTDSSYARDILRKYALDSDSLAARLQREEGDG